MVKLTIVRATVPVPETESPASHIRNAMTILRAMDPFTQSPTERNADLTAIEGRLYQALNMLEPQPVRGLPEFSGDPPMALPQADGDSA